MDDLRTENNDSHEKIYAKINECLLSIAILEKEVYRLRTWGFVFIAIVVALIGPLSNFIFERIVGP